MSTIRLALIITISAMLCSSAMAEGTAGTTGRDLLNDCTKAYADPLQAQINMGYCLGFIRAVWQMSNKGCGPAGIPMREVAHMFMRYATNHPERLHLLAEEVVEAAIVEAFQCKPVQH
jgi:hypothetical protein